MPRLAVPFVGTPNQPDRLCAQLRPRPRDHCLGLLALTRRQRRRHLRPPTKCSKISPSTSINLTSVLLSLRERFSITLQRDGHTSKPRARKPRRKTRPNEGSTRMYENHRKLWQ